MINLLLITAAMASDVYEICVHKKQKWSERQQEFVTQYTRSMYTTESIQFIIHQDLFEVNREKREISHTFLQDDMKRWREHQNSFFCYHEDTKSFLWEFHKRNGDVTRDVMKVCVKNGGSP